MDPRGGAAAHVIVPSCRHRTASAMSVVRKSASGKPAPRTPPATAEAGASIPRYRQILSTLLERLDAGRYPVGSLLPTESDLCREFDVSRYTIRAALAHLVDHGMVERRKGIGSVVVAPQSQRTYQQSISSLGDLYQYAMDTHVEIQTMKMVSLDQDMAEVMGVAAGEQWLQIDLVRWDVKKKHAICYIRAFVPARLAWIGPELHQCRGPLYEHLEARSGESIVRATQEIRAARMPASVWRPLGEKAGAVALCLIRHYYSQQGSMICSFNWHPAQSFSYRMELERKR